jgi:NTE family protein
MGVPAIFAPIELDGRLLVDGGITNNLPIDLAKEMGADIVIAVDITSPMLAREALGNLLAITDQLTRLLVVNNTQAQQAMLSPQDVLIVPELDAVSAVSFDAAANAIEAGYRAIEGKADALASLKLASLPLVELPHEVQQGRLIDEVRLKNNSSLSDAVLLAQINTTTGEAFSQEQLERDVNRIHGLGHFELVSYQISKNNDQSIVEIAAEQKSWGTNFLHFGFNLESEFKHDSRF